MTELLTAAQMRAIEQAAIDSGEVTGLELMERAGLGVVEAIFEEWPELKATSHRAVVLCGPGNNGGDGFVVARLLKEWGWEVEVFLYGDAAKLPPDARVNYERWCATDPVKSLTSELIDASRVKLVLDALFGTGLSRPISPDLLSAGEKIFDSRGHTFFVAVDILSGICSDSGRPLEGRAIWPHSDLSIAFHRGKCAHYLADGARDRGCLRVVDIGLEKGLRDSDDRIVLAGNYVRRLRKSSLKHKYSNGHALVLSGGPGKTGAARLAARGALRIGSGLVTLACPGKALWEVATHSTAIMVQTLDGPPGLREVLEDERINALCLGPGMGLGADTQALVLEALRYSAPAPEPGPLAGGGPGSSPGQGARGVVLDADALSRFERNPEVLFDGIHENVVLTPHAGEFKRLFPDIAEKLEAPATTGPAYSKVDATREAAKRAGCVVLFKGPDTVIADAKGRCSINSSAYERATPWLATAGSGDVLAGFITGLLARGFAPMQAAETAAWLHTECALSFGPGLIAEDLPEELPKVFRALL